MPLSRSSQSTSHTKSGDAERESRNAGQVKHFGVSPDDRY